MRNTPIVHPFRLIWLTPDKERQIAVLVSANPSLNHGVSVQFEVKVGGRVMMSVRKTFVVRLPIFKIVDSRFDFDYLAV